MMQLYPVNLESPQAIKCLLSILAPYAPLSLPIIGTILNSTLEDLPHDLVDISYPTRGQQSEGNSRIRDAEILLRRRFVA